MKMDMINPYVMKIIIAARKQDSISAIAERINVSYGWTHKWISELIGEGIFKEKWKGVVLQENNKIYKQTIKFMRNNVNPVSFYYTALTLCGIQYCFTKTDAVYIWTEGRYNIARYKAFYPIFIKVKKSEYTTFLWYCKKLGLKINKKRGVFYVPEITAEVAYAKKGMYQVESLDTTIKFMKENAYNFEPALEMIDEMYCKGLGIKYREADTA